MSKDGARSSHLERLLDKAKSLPSKPGCYLMKGHRGNVLYVGKSKALKARVGSYFQQSKKSPKTEILVSHIRDFDFVITANESEALVLENNLIKKHSPKYNIMLKDDKSYPYVEVNWNEDYPRLSYRRRPKRGENRELFGPFVWGTGISEVLRILTKSFALRDCTLREFQSRKQPCLLYQMHQCSASCVSKISRENYRSDLNLALGFFRGKTEESFQFLENRMLQYAEEEKFEAAALVRDQIDRLREFTEFGQQKNAENFELKNDVDIVAFYQGEIEVDLAIYLVRNGLLLGHKNFHFPVIDMNEGFHEELVRFLLQYYSGSHDTYPTEVVVDLDKDNQKLFQSAMGELFSVAVTKPYKEVESLFNLAEDQSKEHQRFRTSNEESVFVGLNKLADLLQMRERPVVMECFDVAIFQGKSPTASQVVFYNGKPDKKAYRHYALEERPEGNNDFAMMKEMLERRLKHGNLPDVFVVDGGKGQVGIFLEALKEFGENVPVVGIAKARTEKGFQKEKVDSSDERLIIPGRSNPYILRKCLSLYRIVTQMRDEAHRFSRRLHHKKEKKRTLSTWLDEIPGVGPKSKQKVLEKLDMPKNELVRFSIEELVEKFGINKSIARKIWEYLQNEGESDSTPHHD